MYIYLTFIHSPLCEYKYNVALFVLLFVEQWFQSGVERTMFIEILHQVYFSCFHHNYNVHTKSTVPMLIKYYLTFEIVYVEWNFTEVPQCASVILSFSSILPI